MSQHSHINMFAMRQINLDNFLPTFSVVLFRCLRSYSHFFNEQQNTFLAYKNSKPAE